MTKEKANRNEVVGMFLTYCRKTLVNARTDVLRERKRRRNHEVLFCGPDEVITLRHTAYSRSIFANGAINAAVYLAKKEPGLYNMSNMIAEM